MNLYRISQEANDGYDSYDSAIVAAESEDEARLISPCGDHHEWNSDNHYCGSWVRNPSEVTVELIGTAIDGTKQGVILGSFNAG